MAARCLNKVLLIGNLTRDPELRYTPQGTAVCSFGLATNRQWVTETGERREEAEFHRIVAWNKLAELCSQLLAKGRKVYVEGRLQTRTWTGSDGNQRTTTEIVIDNMIILDSKRAFEEARAAAKEVAGGEPAAAPAPPVASATDQVEEEEKEEEKKEEKKAPQPKAKASSEDESKAKKTKKEKEEEAQEEITPEDIPF